MDMMLLFKFTAAFVFVISLMMLMSWGLKKAGLSGASMMPGGKRRLKIVEYLPIDHKRKLVLVRRDDREHLIVLGPSGETVVENNIPATDNIIELVKEQKSVQG